MARLVYGGVFERYPDITFMTHHMGGMIPYFANRIDAFSRSTREEYRKLGIGGDSGIELSVPAIEHFKRFHNDTVSNGSVECLAMARNFFGTERLLFGTDFPFGPPDGSWAVDEKRALRGLRHQRRRPRGDLPRQRAEDARAAPLTRGHADLVTGACSRVAR